MRECECERVPKRTYINYLLLLLEGIEGRQERAARKIITHSWNEEAQKKQVGVKNLLNTKSKKSQENLRRSNLSGN